MESIIDEKLQQKSAGSLEYYVKDLLTLLRHLRVWPYNSFSTYKLLCINGLILILLITNVLLILSEIVAVIIDFNIQRFANVIGSLGLHAIGFLKWTFCMKKSNEIIELIGQLNNCHLLSMAIDRNKGVIKKYQEAMEDTRATARMFLRLWLCGCAYGVLHWCTNPFLVKLFVKDPGPEFLSTNKTLGNILPYIAWHPWDTNNVSNYYYTYMLQVMGSLASTLGSIVYDAFYLTVLMFMRAQFHYLNIALTYEYTNFENRNGAAKVDLRTKLTNCVAQHVVATNILDTLEVLVSPIMFAQCIETMIVLCLLSFEASAIQITMDVQCMMKLWSMLEYFTSLAIQLYLFCFYATEIKFLSLKVADSVYCCAWDSATYASNFEVYRQLSPQSLKYLVIMLLARAQKPIMLTGGPFYELSLETFRSIIGMAISNSVILRQVSGLD